ncbi:hypothetical protein COCCADRAFT_69933, partial [Bipolaris zeicola 26-R-13]
PTDVLEQTVTWCRRALILTDPLITRRDIIATKVRLSPSPFEWVIQDDRYRKWLDSSKKRDRDRGSQLLWISGTLGTDTTMLSVFLTEELEKHTAVAENAELVFFFYNSKYRSEPRVTNRSNTSTLMLYGLIGQIVTKRPELSQHLYGNLERLNKMQENLEAAQRSEGIFEETPEMSAFMLDIFCTLIRAPGLGTMFCVIEGFGDCDRS